MSLATNQIKAALLSKYCAPEWGILFEVGNDTGFKCNRHADAVAMSLWPSRGLSLHGMEIKVSRSDWVKELRDPAKAESIAKFCDFWWLVVGDKEIVKPGELPASWGLLAPKGEKLVCVKESVKNEQKQPVTRGFLAALFRRIHEQNQAPGTAVKEAAWKDGYERGKTYTSERVDHEKARYAELQRAVDGFEKASGVRIHTYKGPHIGEQFHRCFAPPTYKQELEQLLSRASLIRQNIAQALATATPTEICEYNI